MNSDLSRVLYRFDMSKRSVSDEKLFSMYMTRRTRSVLASLILVTSCSLLYVVESINHLVCEGLGA